MGDYSVTKNSECSSLKSIDPNEMFDMSDKGGKGKGKGKWSKKTCESDDDCVS